MRAVEDTLRKLYKEYNDVAPPPPPRPPTLQAVRQQPSRSRLSNTLSSTSSKTTIIKSDAVMNEFMQKFGVAGIYQRDDVDEYLAEQCEDMTAKNFDILNWWKVNSSRYKVLFQVAKDVLAVPISTVASESAFSTGGRILDPFRSSLSPKMVEAINCLKNWSNARDEEYEPVVLRQYMDDVESYEDCYEVVSGDNN